MTRHHILSLALAQFLAAGFGAMAVLAQSTAGNPASVKPPESKPPSPPAMVFFVAKGGANACGTNCDTWIAADGKIDAAAAQKLRVLLSKLGRPKLPIFLNSPGGSVTGAM